MAKVTVLQKHYLCHKKGAVPSFLLEECVDFSTGLSRFEPSRRFADSIPLSPKGF